MSNSLDKYERRRVMGKDGWLYFCRQCGDYFPYKDFHKRKNTYWGINASCKKHHKVNKVQKSSLEKEDVSHLKLQPITEDDWVQVRVLLKRLGYCYDCGKTIHQQFMERHNL